MESPEVIKLLEEIKSLIKHTQYRSTETNLLNAALSKAQGSYPKIKPNREADYGSYADLDEILHKVRKPLADNGLSVSFRVEEYDGVPVLFTEVSHEGQWKSCKTTLNQVSKGMQDYSKELDFHKCSHVKMLLGITYSNNVDDDDGQFDLDRTLAEATDTGKPEKYKKKQGEKLISESSYDEIVTELSGNQKLAQQLLNYFQITTFRNLPKSQLDYVLTEIRKLTK